MDMIERYWDSEQGYHPFLIREGWQVAQLNYLPGYGMDEIRMVEAHKQTDEVFILFQGTAVLIAATEQEGDLHFEAVNMEKGVTYNIPAGMWHNIAMDKEAQMIIVERSNTHKTDCSYKDLTEEQHQTVTRLIQSLL